eukprot:3311877-Prymnesium_polylepis.1
MANLPSPAILMHPSDCKHVRKEYASVCKRVERETLRDAIIDVVNDLDYYCIKIASAFEGFSVLRFPVPHGLDTDQPKLIEMHVKTLLNAVAFNVPLLEQDNVSFGKDFDLRSIPPRVLPASPLSSLLPSRQLFRFPADLSR